MPPGRTRSRLVTKDNDENVKSTRMTRAKAAALHADELSSLPTKSAVQPAKTATTSNAAPQRKRTALGDVSNFGKGDGEAKRGLVSKGLVSKGLVSKAAHPTGVQKNASRPVGRPALASKNTNKTETIKRASAGTGAPVAGPKRKAPSFLSANVKKDAQVEEEEEEKEEDNGEEEVEPARKKKFNSNSARRMQEDASVENVACALKAKSHMASAPEMQVSLQQHPEDHPRNLDRADRHDHLMVAEYAAEIFVYLRELEKKTIPNANYMTYQDDLDWKTRAILVDWLVEVHARFHLLPETLFIAVNIMDRFLSQKVVQLDRLQLVGITAMFIAAKYEEVCSPYVVHYSNITDNGCSESEILSAERFILTILNYDLSYTSPITFLRRFSKADNYDIQSRTVSKYLMEIALLDHRFIAICSSLIAASALYLARLMLNRGTWDSTIAHYAGYSEDDLEPVISLMIDYLARPVPHEALFKKYANKKFLKGKFKETSAGVLERN